jgi:AcrR family transcriptional regulator
MTASKSAEQPPSARGRLRRKSLVQAAHVVFARDGFMEARITDIALQAEMAHGSFYTYFPSKEAIFREVALDLQKEMSASGERDDRDVGPVQRIARANRQYLSLYRENARIMGAIEEASTVNSTIRQIRNERSDLFNSRTERAIRRLQDLGQADPDLNLRLTALALTSMTSRLAYLWFAADSGPQYKFEFSEGVEGITKMWVNALGIREGITDQKKR